MARIVFMGTPDFALPPFRTLLRAGHSILCVYTQPDKPKGRGKKIQAPPVKEAALSMGVPVFQPASMKEEAVFEALTALSPDLFVVVAYGHILKQKILDIPRLGAVNIHASLLPKYRGAAPIQWTIARGEKESGVTTMLMDAGMDTGDILLQKTLPIEKRDTAASLHDKLARLGGELIVETVAGLEKGEITPMPQDASMVTYAPILQKSHGEIDWCKSAGEIDAHIRGMTPWPGAFTRFNKQSLKIFEAVPIAGNVDAPPGTVLPAPKDTLLVATGKGSLMVLSLQGASGKRLGTADYLRGKPIPAGTLFT